MSDVNSDPAVDQWRAALGQSTSAQLRETQAALAASQQDLTRMEAERDALANRLDVFVEASETQRAELEAGREAALHEQEHGLLQVGMLRARLGYAGEELEKARAECDALALLNAELKAEVLQAATDRVTAAEREQVLRQELTSAMRQLAGVEHDLEHARFERDRARSWQVARNDDTGDCVLCGFPIVRGQAVEPQPGTTKGSYAHVHCPTPTPTKES